MATWYFHPGVGTDSPGTGSIGSPCATLGYAVNTLATAGDTVLGYGGSTSTENAVLTKAVTIGSYGSGQVTIAGGTGAAITVTNQDGYTINNIAATGATAAYASGNLVGIIQFLNTTSATQYTNGITISNCTISGPGQAGILFVAKSTTGANGYQNLTIVGNNVSGCIQIGIYLCGDGSGTYFDAHYSACTVGTRAAPNVVHGIVGTTGTNYRTRSGHAIVVDGANATPSPVLLQYNLVYSCSTAGGPGSGDAIWCSYSTGVLMQYNVVHDMSTNGGVADGSGMDIDADTTGVVSQYNYVYNCEGAGLICFNNAGGGGATGPGNTHRFNLVVNCGSYSSTYLGGISGSNYNNPVPTYIYNNTVISSGVNPAVRLYATIGTVKVNVLNNLLVTQPGTPLVVCTATLDATCVIDHNYYVTVGSASPTWSLNGTTYTGLAAWQTASGLDASSVYSSTLPIVGPITPIPAITPGSISLDTPYWLMPGSGPLAAGANLSSLYSISPGSVDLNGNAIGASGYSIGAINPAYFPPAVRLATGAALMVCG